MKDLFKSIKPFIEVVILINVIALAWNLLFRIILN